MRIGFETNAGGGGAKGGTKRAAPLPASSAQAMASANAIEPVQKKQRVWGAPAPPQEEDEDGKDVEKEEKEEGTAVSNLLGGLRAKLGDELSVRPLYKVVEKGELPLVSLFSLRLHWSYGWWRRSVP